MAMKLETIHYSIEARNGGLGGGRVMGFSSEIFQNLLGHSFNSSFGNAELEPV